MIVKNEEGVLNRCLDSVKDLIDEIIIVDTGSSDKTKEIAMNYTSKVYDYKWTNDFSAARNFAQSHATGEWIFYLDADEYVDKNNLKQILDQLKNSSNLHKYDAFVVNQINFLGKYGENVGKNPTARLYKNDSTIYFRRKIHEQLYKTTGQLSIGFLELNIYHSGYLINVEREKNKKERNIALIREELNRNSKSGFDYFNLGNEYLTHWQIELALQAYQKAFQLKGSINKVWVPTAVERIIFCLIELKRYSEALEIIDSALGFWSNVIDFRAQKALIYFLQNRLDDSEDVLLKLIDKDYEYKTIQSLSYSEFLPYYLLGVINQRKNEIQKAVYYYAQALNYNDKDLETMKYLYELLVKYERKENVVDFILRQPSIENETKRAFTLKVLLDLGEEAIVSDLLKNWHTVPTQGMRAKINLLQGKYNITKLIIKKTILDDLLLENWIDPYDIIILALQLKDSTLFSKLVSSNLGKDFAFLKDYILENKVKNKVKLKKQLIALLERCIIYKNYGLFENLVSFTFRLKLQTEVGNLLYKYGLKELAIEFYSYTKDSNKFDSQAFVNIIETFKGQDNYKEAIEFAFLAIKQGIVDFRIFDLAIQSLKELGLENEKETLLTLALKYYPDSKYLKEVSGI
jgi:glycosyltransferase involved in cell wall biosynthesis